MLPLNKRLVTLCGLRL